MLGNLMWLVTAGAIVGAVANIYGKRWGFVLWALTNLLWAAYNAWLAQWAQSALFTVYLGLSIWGIVKWKDGRPNKKDGEA